MREWIVHIYAGQYHTNPTWRFSVDAESKAMAITVGLWLFRQSAEYTDEFDRVDADKI
jgi:hypothetical protein